MNEWITERMPTEEDADDYGQVWVSQERSVISQTWSYVEEGTPWQPTHRPEPYVKPKRFEVQEAYGEGFVVIDSAKFSTAIPVPTREAAERIAAIYEETVP